MRIAWFPTSRARRSLPTGRDCYDATTSAVSLVLGLSVNLSPVCAAESGARQALTPLGMFLAADVVVKSIIVVLLVASVATWAVWIGKTIELMIAGRRSQQSLVKLQRYTFLAEARSKFSGESGLVSRLVEEAAAEMRVSEVLSDTGATLNRVASRLADIETQEARAMRSGTGLLATIGSTAPFVGLFGTVWGIMNSFIGISASQTTNLAVVAPGIAEALLATAVGLIAAIPAVVIYNGFARALARHRGLVRQCISEVSRMASRDLDRGAAGTTRWQKQAAE
jgi:biopolymer transport protein ExbB